MVNVFSLFSLEQLKLQLSETKCIALMTDSSNHGNIKLFPVVVLFYDPHEGIQVKLLDIQSQSGETSDIVAKYLEDVTV